MPAHTDTKPTSASPSESESETGKGGLDLSLTQIVGGALAAMTAAALGSRLGVAGTVIGAAVASVIAALAGSLYTASLKRTRDTVRSVWTGVSSGTPTRVDTVSEALAQTEIDAAAAPPISATEPVERPGRRFPRVWKRILVGALATFALAAGIVTGLELVTGQALSGGSGTTVERVRERGPEKPAEDKPKPSESPSEDSTQTAEPSTDGSSEPSDGPSESAPETTEAPAEQSAPSAAESDPTQSGTTSSPNPSGE